MSFENMPSALLDIFQQNMLDRAFQESLEAINVFRRTTYKLPLPVRSGEQMIYTRAGKISPVFEDLAPSVNVPLDNGLTQGGVGTANPAPYPFEQFSVTIGMLPGSPIDLNLVQNQETIASLFAQNMIELGENAALSMDLRAIRVALQAYEGGNTFATAASAGTGPTTVTVDNAIGFATAFATATFQNGATFPYGLPALVSSGNPLAAVLNHAGTKTNISVIGVAYDNASVGANGLPTNVTGANNSSMAANGLNAGWSGTLTISGAVTIDEGDSISAVDGSAILRPNGKLTRYAMDASDTIGAQLVINAVAALRRNGVKPPLSDGTYPCYIDPVVDAQFFTDPQYQIMSQGQVASADFHNARVSRNFGVTFIPTTNLPAYTLTNHAAVSLTTRRALVCGEKWLQESPFAGVGPAIASLPDMGVADYRVVDDIVFVNRMPLDRAGQILSAMWYWIGGFVVPTFATITPAVIPTATAARYKSAVIIEVASAS
jgi:hypothetical protein